MSLDHYGCTGCDCTCRACTCIVREGFFDGVEASFVEPDPNCENPIHN